jgi:hypothetical protein
VSLELSSVCILNATGQIFREAKIASEPDVLTAFLASLNSPLTRVGLEAGPLSQWLYAGLQNAGFEVVLLETRHVKAALSAMIVKTDRCVMPVASPNSCTGACSVPPIASRQRRFALLGDGGSQLPQCCQLSGLGCSRPRPAAGGLPPSRWAGLSIFMIRVASACLPGLGQFARNRTSRNQPANGRNLICSRCT